jgi:hypothetical protein
MCNWLGNSGVSSGSPEKASAAITHAMRAIR